MDAPGGTAQGAGAVKSCFCKILLMAVLLSAGVFLYGAVLEPGTPVFAAPAHNQKIVAVAQAPVEVESLPEVFSIISKHPLARYFFFTPVRLPDGRTGFAVGLPSAKYQWQKYDRFYAVPAFLAHFPDDAVCAWSGFSGI